MTLGDNSLRDEAINSILEPFGARLSGDLANQIREYISLLLAWNRKVNLTRIVEPRSILERHFGESFFAVKAVPISDGRLVDIGSGAGFPAIPIKMAKPELKVTLVEPNMKKAVFLKEIARRLNLSDINVECHPFEELKLPDGFADFVTSRAVGDYERLLAWAVDIVNARGRAVLWVGVKDQTRISRVPKWVMEKSVQIPKSRERMLLSLVKRRQ